MKKATISILLLCLMLHAAAQKGWTSLFDGKTFKGWYKVAGYADYQIINGAIVGTTVLNTPNTFLVADKEYSDFILEFDVRIEDTTTNSGVQFRSQYDPAANNNKGSVYGYQFEINPSARGWTGGIYDEARRGWLYPLSLNPDAKNLFKQAQYNTMRIECMGNIIQTFVNNQPAAQLQDTANSKGLIGLQVHEIGNNTTMVGKKIYWKNIRIKTKKVKLSKIQVHIHIENTIAR